ncbi:CDK2-associated and cullin domain-containing protein 1 [Acipenser ruthenus]|uniref:CDK2-associated and cullin domain-containing protein 1 n=1 Tax=Acipenser ruthenus TaxID=7906 RepID=A0A444ULU0_ACIRT|nr:CDK2-associated and cullin domain-containing protein 1 [Acipenser ruthenus]
MDESMDEDASFEMMDDHNHNNWEASADAYRQHPPNPQQQTGHAAHSTVCEAEGSTLPNSGAQSAPEPGNGVGDCEDSAGTGASAGASAAAGGKVTLNINSSTSKFLMNVITTEDYKSTYWPKLESAIEQLLTQNPQDYIPISYEQIYSCVYKCVCQQHSEQMYNDLIHKITGHLQHISEELQASPPDQYIEKFDTALAQYMAALQSIVPLFIYMNKFYIETKLNRDLKEDLTKLFTDYVAEKHVCTLMPTVMLPGNILCPYLQLAISKK